MEVFGVRPGAESMKECREREEREADERARRQREIEEQRARVSGSCG